MTYLHNKGSVPAHKVIYDQKLIVNGIPMAKPVGIERGEMCVFPEEVIQSKLATSDAKEFKDWSDSRLDLVVTINYEGPNGQKYNYQYEGLRHPSSDNFQLVRKSSS
jgi:hypothetical protein